MCDRETFQVLTKQYCRFRTFTADRSRTLDRRCKRLGWEAVDARDEALDEGFNNDDDKTCNQNFLTTLILSCTSFFTISRTLQDVINWFPMLENTR